ncbi:MAG: vWA domain-containing protein [Acidimicrobiales bacterium]
MVFRRRRRRRQQRFTYSAWDGTQSDYELTAEDLFRQMTDDLAYHGDPNAALRNMLQNGFDMDGERMEGLREMLEQLRDRREELLDSGDVGGVFSEIAEKLREIVQTERDNLAAQAEYSAGGDDPAQAARDAAAETERNLRLDMLPPDLPGQIGDLQSYDFTSKQAQDDFDELVDDLRNQLMQQAVDGMSDAVQNMTPDDMQAMKDMLAELNEMLEQRANGEEPDFDGFMERHGDFFPENPQNLDELLEAMAQRMAAAQAMLNSMTPEQRAQLQELSDQLLEDMDLQWQMAQLGENLQGAFPDLNWGQGYETQGADPLGFGEAMNLMNDLGDLDQLEQMLRGTTNPGALAEVDFERAAELLGEDSARSIEAMAKFTQMLEDAGLINNKEGSLELTPRALRKIGQNVLDDLYSKLTAERLGRHNTAVSGVGHERNFETKAYEFGDPFSLNIERTVRNAIRRSGGGTPVQLTPDDFEVERTERTTRTSTVLMLDLSLSMPMRDNFAPAKKVALALQALISGQYPQDYLGIVTFSEVAREIPAKDLPELSWDYVYGTNMQHGFQLARRMLARQSGTKQILMVTDGEPTAHIAANGRPVFNYPPTRETIDLTLAEVNRCTRDQVRINIFMLDATPYLTSFIEQITRMNGGRAFFTDNQNLGDFVLVDFVEQKRKMIRRAG